MPNYQLGKIYKIVCNVTGKVYYGSTCEPTLAKRLAKHVGNFKRWSNEKKESYVTSYSILENNNYRIVLVEKCPCDDKMELQQRERYYIETNECVNKVVPLRTRTEYNQDNKEKIAEYNKQQCKKYREVNKDKISERRRQIINCACGKTYTLCHKARHFKSQKHQNYLEEQDI